MKASYGFVETRGYVAAIVAADAMVKAARVELIPYRKIGAALVTVVVRGELGACQAAVQAGEAAARAIGEFVSSNIIPNPYDDTEHMLTPDRPNPAPVKSPPKAAPKTRTKPKRKPASAKAKPEQPKVRPQAPEEKLTIIIKSKKQGVTLKELETLLQKPAAEIRLLLKELMDAGVVEKIQQKYYWIG